MSLEPDWSVNYSAALAEFAENLGYSCIWVPDGGPAPPYSDAIVTLSAIASQARKIRFGSAIVNFYTRNPAWIASSFMALSDLASRGSQSAPQRAILGIGVGSEYNVAKFGIRERKGVIEEMREAVESIMELFQGKQVTVRTSSFAIDGVTLSKAKKKIPIYIGSSSPKGQRLAGRIADGVILTDRIPLDLDESLKHIDLGIGDGQRSRQELEVVESVVISLDENRQKARKAATTTCAYLVAWMDEKKAELNKIDLAAKKRISAFIEAGDEASAAKLVDDRMTDLLTASGTAEECLEKCREYMNYDIDQVAFCEPFGPDQKESIRAIAKKVIPKL